MGAGCTHASPGSTEEAPHPEEAPPPPPEVVAHFMPSYCPLQPQFTDAHRDLINRSWELAMSGETMAFRRIRKQMFAQGKLANVSPVVYFYHEFYAHFFQLQPEARALFQKSMQTQGKMLARMLELIVKRVTNSTPEVFRRTMRRLVIGHNKFGVRAHHFSSMGQTLLLTLRKMLGEEWTPDVHEAWVTVWAIMMEEVIPNLTEVKQYMDTKLRPSDPSSNPEMQTRRGPPQDTPRGVAEAGVLGLQVSQANEAQAQVQGQGRREGSDVDHERSHHTSAFSSSGTAVPRLVTDNDPEQDFRRDD